MHARHCHLLPVVMAPSLQVVPKSLGDQSLFLTEEAEKMRWFLLPSEAQLCLMNETITKVTPPFQPRRYPSLKEEGGSVVSQTRPLPGERDLSWKITGSSSLERQENGTSGMEGRKTTENQAMFHDASFERTKCIADGSITFPLPDMGESQNSTCTNEGEESGGGAISDIEIKPKGTPRFHHPPKRILKPTIEVSSYPNEDCSLRWSRCFSYDRP